MSSRAPSGGSIALRTRWTRRSELVTVPSASHHAALAGRTTSASSAVLVRKMSWTTRWSRPSRREMAWLTSASDWAGFSPSTYSARQFAPAHGLEHLGEVPAVGRRDRAAPGGVEAGPDVRVEDVGEAGEAVGDGPHVAAALHVVLAPQRVEAGAVATHVPAQQRQVDERQDVVDGVVVLGDAQRPAQLGPVRPGVGMGQFPDQLGRDPGLRLGPGQGPLLHAGGELVEAGGGPFDETAVLQPGGEDLPGHGVGQGDVGAHVQGTARRRRIGPSTSRRGSTTNSFAPRRLAWMT